MMTDVTRLKQLLEDQSPPPPSETPAQSRARVEHVHQWHDEAFALIRGVLEEAGISYSPLAVKIALRGDMPGLACGQEITLQAPNGRKLVIASVGPNVIHIEALPMIRIALGEDGPTLLQDGRNGAIVRTESFTPESFVGFLERWAADAL